MIIHITIVTLAQPCSSCNILNSLTEEVVTKLEGIYPGLLNIERVVIDGPGYDLHSINGLEVEKFPALILNGLQLTAGSIPNRKQIINMIDMEV